MISSFTGTLAIVALSIAVVVVFLRALQFPRVLSALLAIWVSAAVVPAVALYLKPSTLRGMTFAIPLLILVVVATGALVAFSLTPIRTQLISAPLTVIISTHIGRAFIGMIFVLLGFSDLLEPTFAYEVGFGDILVGVSAAALAPQSRLPKLVLGMSLWNICGFLAVINSIRCGTLYATPWLDAHSVPSPLGYLPAFTVPFYLLIHLLTASRLRHLAWWPS